MSLPAITQVTSLPDDVDVTILGLADAGDECALVGASDALVSAANAALGAPLEEIARRLGGTTKPGTAVALPTPQGVVVVTGLGEADVTPAIVRKAAAAGMKKALEVSGDAAIRVALSLETVEPEVVSAAIEGALLAAYRYAKPGKKPAKGARLGSLALVSPADVADVVAASEITCEAVWRARDWVNTPANVLYPETFAAAAKEAVKGLKVDVEILDPAALTKAGFGGVLAVGGGSARGPRVVKLTWAPKGAQNHLSLIGKGMTFDAGGLDLKPSEAMYDMKCDMAGAAAVLASFVAIVKLKLPVKVTAYAGMAENMPSGTAYRPSDVLTMYGGTTVENGNCDAEGRLVLADVITWASEEHPDLMVDIATLTGACQVALGTRTTGLMVNHDEVADAVLDAAEAACENVWQLPIPAEADENLASDVADIKSTGPRWGGALNAAAFLRSFVGEGIGWAHLDIAGPAWATSAYDEVTKGGTGVGVRTLISLARSLSH